MPRRASSSGVRCEVQSFKNGNTYEGDVAAGKCVMGVVMGKLTMLYVGGVVYECMWIREVTAC